MQPSVYFSCTNYSCSEFNNEILIHGSEEKYSDFFVETFCKSCRQKGKLRYVHKDIESNSSKEIVELMMQMSKEYHLLKRLIDNGISNEDDKIRFDYLYNLLSELECPGCGQLLVNHEH